MEEWKDISGYEGLYQVSNKGQVRSFHSGLWMIMKQSVRKGGYKKIFLRKNKQRKSYFVHRLVAIAFIPNPNNLPIINHKDENPSNNCVENLEWCTSQYNMTYGTVIERIRNTKFTKAIPLLMFDKHGQLKAKFDNLTQAVEKTGFPHSNIISCYKGRINAVRGYIFLLETDIDNLKERLNRRMYKTE